MTRGQAGHSPSNVQKYLKGQNYPARREELIQTARKNKAPSEVMEIIKALPEDEFGGPKDVMKAYDEENGHQDARRSGHQASSEARASTAKASKEETSSEDGEEMEDQGEDQ